MHAHELTLALLAASAASLGAPAHAQSAARAAAAGTALIARRRSSRHSSGPAATADIIASRINVDVMCVP